MSHHRMEKINHFIKQEVSEIVLHKIKDPRVGMTTITKVETSPDLKTTKIYVSFYGDDLVKQKGLEGLKSAAGFIRAELGKNIHTRYTPEPIFILDSSIEYSVHISKMLQELIDNKDEG